MPLLTPGVSLYSAEGFNLLASYCIKATFKFPRISHKNKNKCHCGICGAEIPSDEGNPLSMGSDRRRDYSKVIYTCKECYTVIAGEIS